MNKEGHKTTAKPTLGQTLIPGLKTSHASESKFKVNTRYHTRNINQVTLSLEGENLENVNHTNRDQTQLAALNTESECDIVNSAQDYGIMDQPIKMSTFYKNGLRDKSAERSSSRIILEKLNAKSMKSKTNLNSMDFASKGLYTATNCNTNSQKYYFMRESVANS